MHPVDTVTRRRPWWPSGVTQAAALAGLQLGLAGAGTTAVRAQAPAVPAYAEAQAPAVPAPPQVQEHAVPSPAGAIRVVEVFDPADGTRDYLPVSQLTPSEIVTIEEALVRAGQLGAPTGRLDEPTRDALGRFQRMRGLTPCRCVSYETIVVLGVATRTVQILVRSAAENRGEAVTDHDVTIVYGTPPRRSTRSTESTQAPQGAAPGPTEAAPAYFERPPPVWRPGYGYGVYFPFLVAPGVLFPPPPITSSPAPPRRGLPIGHRGAVPPRGGISTRRSAPSTLPPPPG